ncbi:hybrid sensor histidine kinase/response regulator [Rhabdochromatium marinum]|uniref:hybrid sensor histidine kinase/response regulator n=1 Tax=Rhabdochromatium marinum TaxID=48729 RepID=UPI001907D993|nr:hybrid sensor histidine kinase/response regulator [Rhabdochromatium marinum]MBK1649683.1 hypothetical protein [Rhabdochromatium marinum]
MPTTKLPLSDKPSLLVVDDMPDNLSILEAGLARDYRLAMARHGERALALAQEKHPDLILLDVMMPGMDGFQVCAHLKENPVTASIPVVFLTALREEQDEIRGLELGAADYIHKPFNMALVRRRIATHLQAAQVRVALRERNRALKQHAQALHERAEALEEAARQRDEIDRVLRHDLKGPLSPIIGFADLMVEDSNLTEDQRENLHMIGDSARRILEMIQRSLDLYKMETNRYRYQPANQDIHKILRSVLFSVTPFAQSHGVTLYFVPPDDAIHFSVEDMLLHNLLNNLIQNAIEASAPGDVVTIRSQLENPGTKNERLILSVTNPALVPDDVRERFFEKYITSGKQNGTGLGTYSARLMATIMGGTLSMKSAPGLGTRLTLALPKPKSETTPCA